MARRVGWHAVCVRLCAESDSRTETEIGEQGVVLRKLAYAKRFSRIGAISLKLLISTLTSGSTFLFWIVKRIQNNAAPATYFVEFFFRHRMSMREWMKISFKECKTS